MNPSRTYRRTRAALLSAALWMASVPAQALVFTLSPGSEPGIGGADILESYGGGSHLPPVSPTTLGLKSGDDITGLHHGAISALVRWFSVDAQSQGLDGTAVRAASGHQGADIFGAGFLGSTSHVDNSLVMSHTELGLSAGANIDAVYWFSRQPGIPHYLTLAAGSPSLALLGAGPADILVHTMGGGLSIWKSAADLKLNSGDAIDGLEVENTLVGWRVVFSLGRGSPTLLDGYSAADILEANSSGGLFQFESAEALGLDALTDNVDALGGTFDCFTDPGAKCYLPLPSSAPLVALGLGALAAGLRVRRPRPRAALAAQDRTTRMH